MEELLKGGSNAIAIFLYLLPGFVGMSTYDYLVEGPKREVFDKLVFALSATLISSLIVGAWYHTPVSPQIEVKGDSSVFALVATMVDSWMARTTVISVAISVILAVLNNYGIPLWAARKFRLTYKTSSVDVWQDVFYKFRGYWIRITFSDSRVLIGWPQYFSAVGQPRELFVADATWWLTDAKGHLTSVDVKGAGVYISDFSAVTAIALLT